jgi:hypothetical protein
MHHRSADTKMAAMKEAVRQGRPDIAVDILSEHPSVRAYIRSPSAKPGWQFHWDNFINEFGWLCRRFRCRNRYSGQDAP